MSAADQHTPVLADGLSAADERTWTWIAHLSGLFAFVGPLVVWLMQKDKSPVVAREAKEALNFQITVAAVTTILFIAGTILSVVFVGLFILLITPLVPLVGVVFAVIGAVKSNQSGTFRYPLTLRLVK
ncbi:DUF4870 domain-containing protein [Microbacterium pygmaeum]|uniref:DUF4870 domain-containing protein n=1 Tax=Microbacterium pygmaeum TaxID=370764 RepID=A0A1G7WAL6_9MICO|nr:DUF4870 domain-containing protein [Microbacterium pygmaeum]SDG68988.1 hypothetical protein SAMN04489810_1009 [Microbacterium pygmaeum]